MTLMGLPISSACASPHPATRRRMLIVLYLLTWRVIIPCRFSAAIIRFGHNSAPPSRQIPSWWVTVWAWRLRLPVLQLRHTGVHRVYGAKSVRAPMQPTRWPAMWDWACIGRAASGFSSTTSAAGRWSRREAPALALRHQRHPRPHSHPRRAPRARPAPRRLYRRVQVLRHLFLPHALLVPPQV